MKVQAVITFQDALEVIGKLFVYDDSDNQVFSADILDLPNIFEYDKIYNCHKTWMNDMAKNHFEIQNVEGHTKVFIHNGNFATGKKIDTEACILIGNGIADIDGNGEKDVLNSVKTLEAFENIMSENDFPLTFINSASSV